MFLTCANPLPFNRVPTAPSSCATSGPRTVSDRSMVEPGSRMGPAGSTGTSRLTNASPIGVDSSIRARVPTGSSMSDAISVCTTAAKVCALIDMTLPTTAWPIRTSPPTGSNDASTNSMFSGYDSPGRPRPRGRCWKLRLQPVNGAAMTSATTTLTTDLFDAISCPHRGCVPGRSCLPKEIRWD